jgi:hypothetical protein
MAKGVRDVIRRAAKGSSWSHFMDYASPALFEVMPLRALMAQGREFVSNGSDARRYAKVRKNIASSLKARGLEVELGPQENDAKGLVPADLAEPVRRETGDRILLALGIYLVCLYDVLESLDLEFDVRGAFDRTCGRS